MDTILGEDMDTGVLMIIDMKILVDVICDIIHC